MKAIAICVATTIVVVTVAADDQKAREHVVLDRCLDSWHEKPCREAAALGFAHAELILGKCTTNAPICLS